MSLPLIAAAGAGASALRGLNSPGHAAPTVQPGKQSWNFQQLMAAMQQGGVNLKDLMALSGTALQAKIKSLNPQQQQALAQQLFGAKLTVQDPTGSKITGSVSNIRLEGSSPTLDVAGVPYTLDKIQAINQAQV